MDIENVAPDTEGVMVELLSTVDLGPEIEGMAGFQLRMRMVTFRPGGVFRPLHDHKGRPGMVYVCKERSRTIDMEWPRSLGRESAGRRTRTPPTGSRIGVRRRRWRSRSTSSGNSEGWQSFRRSVEYPERGGFLGSLAIGPTRRDCVRTRRPIWTCSRQFRQISVPVAISSGQARSFQLGDHAG